MKHYLGICLVLATLALIVFLGLRSCVSSVDHTIDHVRDAFVEALHVQPKVTVDQRVVLTQTSPIAEFAVVTKEELVSVGLNEHLEVMSVQIPLTEKKITVEATYRIKAGFDLREPYSVTIDPATRVVRATMPHAKILSVEPFGDLKYKGEDSMLNRITDDEHGQIITNLNAAARSDAENSGLKADAEKQVSDRLNELLQHNGQSIEIKWDSAPPVAIP